jgi:hypothetical protein
MLDAISDRRWQSEDVLRFLQGCRLLHGSAKVTLLKGGYWNDVLRVEAPGIDWVVKRFVSVLEGTLFPNLPGDEMRALEVVGPWGIAPRPVAFYPDQGTGAVLVYEYSHGRSWQGDVGKVAQLLRRKLAAPAAGFRRVPCDTASIEQEGSLLFAQCAADSMTEIFRTLRPPPRNLPPLEALHLIHTDIGATNLIEGPHGLHLIDWQCPAQGDPAQDIYCFLSPAFQILNLRSPLTEDKRSTFWQAYGDEDARERHDLLEPALAYRMAGYCVLRHQTLAGQNGPARRRYGRAIEAELARLRSLRA